MSSLDRMPQDIANVNVVGLNANGFPALRYTSGLTVYDEALVHGRWVGRYWAADGKVPAEKHIWEVIPDTIQMLPIQAFCLNIDGQALHSHWRWGNPVIRKEDEINAYHVAAHLTHTVRPIDVKVHTLLNGTAFMTRWLEITNKSDKPAALSGVAPWSGTLWAKRHTWYLLKDKPDHCFTLGYFQSSLSGFEGDFVWRPLKHGTTRIEGRRGHSGYGMPWFIVRNEQTGENFVCNMAWSGNWAMELMCDEEPHGEESNLVFKIEPMGAAPQRIIAPGETILTPRVHMGAVHGDLDDCVQESHKHLRRSVIPMMPEGRRHLVKYSTLNESGEYFLDKKNLEQSLKKQVDIAADLGCEVFIIESGWYGKAATDGTWGIAGDWQPNLWLADGKLKNVREYARQKGLLFALYSEAETVGFDSDLYKAHPDWVLMRDGIPAIGWQRTKRGLLDLTKPEVAQWVENDIIRLIKEYDLDLFRLDANVRYFYEGGQRIADGFIESTFWRYYQALYAMWDRIQKAFPHVILQQASSGGCRNDLGIMSTFHEAFLTDGTHVPRELAAFNGMTLALPPEVFNIAAGLVWPPNEPRGSIGTFLRISCALSHPYIMDVSLMPPEVGQVTPGRTAIFKRYIKLYKDFIRPLLKDCRVFHHSPISTRKVGNDWFVIEYSSPDASQAMALIVRLSDAAEDHYVYRPRGLLPGAEYEVEMDSVLSSMKINGYQAASAGIPLRIEALYASELLMFKKI